MEGAAVSWSDPDTQNNAGAYFLRPGDRAVVRLGKRRPAGFEVDYIERL